MSATFEVTGEIFQIFEPQILSDKFTKREFVLAITDGEYTNYPKFEFNGINCEKLNGFGVGQTVKVHFNLRGKPYTKEGKTMYFTTLLAWKLELLKDVGPDEGDEFPDDAPF